MVGISTSIPIRPSVRLARPRPNTSLITPGTSFGVSNRASRWRTCNMLETWVPNAIRVITTTIAAASRPPEQGA